MTRIKPIRSNMTELHKDDYGTVILFSYETPVAIKTRFGNLRTATKYSVTTTKHINQWLDGADAQTVPQAEIEALC